MVVYWILFLCYICIIDFNICFLHTSIGCALQVNDALYTTPLLAASSCCRHLPQAAAANEGSHSAIVAGLAVPSSVMMVSAGIWLRLPPRKCAATVVVATATSPPVSYLGALLPLLHTLVPRTLSRGDYVLCLCSVWLVLVQFYSM
jgi:hypothetical protein